MHNQQNHNHQEHHHAEGDAAATTATAKLSMAAAASRKTPPHRPNTPTTITIMAIAAAAPPRPTIRTRKATGWPPPLPVANVSAGKSPVWTAPAAPKNRKCRHRTPRRRQRARVVRHRETGGRRAVRHQPADRDAVARRLYPARHSDRQSRRAENLTLRRIRTAAAVSHPDGRQLGAGSG